MGNSDLARAANSASGKSARQTSAQEDAAPRDGGAHPPFDPDSLQSTFERDRRQQPDRAVLLRLYEQMLLIRRFEERAGQLYGLGLIGGFCHLYIGQEAVAVGLQSSLEGGKDSVITGYRDHGHMLAYGIDPKVIMAELTGRQAGISKGKGGSMHMFSTCLLYTSDAADE